MKMTRLATVEAKADAGQRKTGYLEEYLKRGQVVEINGEKWIAVHPEDWIVIRQLYSPSNQPLPSLSNMAKNAAGAGVRIVGHVLKGNQVRVSVEESARRLDICRACEFLQKDQMRCTQCGCHLTGRLVNKTLYASERCPKGKW